MQLQQGTWDINFTVPVVVYADREDYIGEDTFKEDMDIDNFPENGFKEDVSNKLIHRIMKALNLSWTEALRDYHKSIFTTAPHDLGKGIWL